MSITPEYLEDKLRKEISATHLEIIDVSDSCPGAKFQALIVSPEFEGKALLQRHRLVNTALAVELKNIHAFQMKTLTPEQWEQQKQKQ
ncbi:hypothetical protein CHS0354_003706 [Potamilus streckersoni]|uniref:BolA-like protein 2 n=1 Tax=Potamilus streckersoni TaxID=2493646 RepID=A0AAE0SS20_9BIVA|nr:hypothetical protein CHS0354_003706 [Potamilus streckersoni]